MIDFSRDYGLMCPPGPGGSFVQDNICFDSAGREVMPPAPPGEAPAATPQPPADAPALPTDKGELVAALAGLGVKADRRSPVAKLQAMLETARKGA
jgi:hypothetical protein